MLPPVDARQTAFDILYNIEKNCEYSNIGLDKALSACVCDKRDRAFITNLVNGVCERRLTLDYNIKKYLTSPKMRLKPNVRTVLRMGAYEILFFDGVPARASVNEYVKLVKNLGAVYASGMVNAVLRKIAENGLLLPQKDESNYLSVKYSFPQKTVAYFSDIFQEDTEAFLASSLIRPKIYGRVNTVKTDMQSLKELLEQDGISIVPAEQVLANAFYFDASAAFMQSKAFQNGLFHIQDLSSQLCCAALMPKPGNRVLDACAAPGGKTFTIAQMMENVGSVVACDIHKHKIGLIRRGAEKLGLTCVEPCIRNAAEHTEQIGFFDRVLCDVPCSGFGVIRKKAEIKYKDTDTLASLPELQLAILEESAAALKPGGRLVYSTCTVTTAENESVVEKFLQKHPDFSADKSFSMPIGSRSEYGCRLSCFSDDCDGFFFAPLIREESN